MFAKTQKSLDVAGIREKNAAKRRDSDNSAPVAGKNLGFESGDKFHGENSGQWPRTAGVAVEQQEDVK